MPLRSRLQHLGLRRIEITQLEEDIDILFHQEPGAPPLEPTQIRALTADLLRVLNQEPAVHLDEL